MVVDEYTIGLLRVYEFDALWLAFQLGRLSMNLGINL